MGFDPAEPRDVLGRWAHLPGGVSIAEHHSGRLHITSPYDKGFIAAVKDMGGTWSPKSKAWSVPGNHADALEKLIVRTYGDGQSSSSVHAVRSASLPDAVKVSARSNGDIEFRGPYNNDFRLAVKGFGRWDAQNKAWVFPSHRRAAVESAAQKYYGTTSGKPPEAPARSAGRATEKQISYALTLIRRIGSGWRDTDSGQYVSRPPTAAELHEWDARDVSELINELRSEF